MEREQEETAVAMIRRRLDSGKRLPDLTARQAFVVVLALVERAGVSTDAYEQDSPEELAEEAAMLLEHIAESMR